MEILVNNMHLIVVTIGLISASTCYFRTKNKTVNELLAKKDKEIYTLKNKNNEYLNNYNLEDAKHLETAEYKKGVVFENTPDGIVVMKYNKNSEGFEYWSDKNIGYKYLQVVARLFVTKHNCKNLYKVVCKNKCACDDENKCKKKQDDDVFVKKKEKREKKCDLSNKYIFNGDLKKILSKQGNTKTKMLNYKEFTVNN
jgi:hypothetical protein